jgi:hypothetical protein
MPNIPAGLQSILGNMPPGGLQQILGNMPPGSLQNIMGMVGNMLSQPQTGNTGGTNPLSNLVNSIMGGQGLNLEDEEEHSDNDLNNIVYILLILDLRCKFKKYANS